MRSAIIHTVLLGFSLLAASAAIVVPGANGKDGVFAPKANVTIDLRQAVLGAWDDASLESGGNGVYDKDKWAIVFRYESVNIPAGVSVTFKNHYSRAPVVWLVSGDVRIDGQLELSPLRPGVPKFNEPGPGGFRGGAIDAGGIPGSGGFGIGGGARYVSPIHSPVAVHTGPGSATSTGYGSPEITLLIGGSGSGGGAAFGGSGGGAILIAAQNIIEIGSGGYISANPWTQDSNWGGAAGAVRLVCDRLAGSGVIYAVAGSAAGAGRIRAEVASETAHEIDSFPEASVAMLREPVAVVFPPLASKVVIKAIQGEAAPADPKARLGLHPADLVIDSPGVTTVQLETENLDPQKSAVTLYLIPSSGQRQKIAATVKPGGNFARAEWEATVNLQPGSYAMQVHAVAGP